MTIPVDTLLAQIPAGLRDPLIKAYRDIASNFAEHRWEPSELNGGKFSEVVITILSGAIAGNFPSAPTKPSNMKQACLALEQQQNSSAVGDRSLRILIPRTLLPLYEIRNNRGVGHVGGDVSPNLMDATAVYAMSSWIMAELVRIFHAVSTSEAQAAVDALLERKLPLIWAPNEKLRRVLDTTLSASDQTLLVLHQHPSWLDEDDLLKSIEYSNSSLFRSRILGTLHKDRMIEYDKGKRAARISPKGSEYVELKIIAPRLS